MTNRTKVHRITSDLAKVF